MSILASPKREDKNLVRWAASLVHGEMGSMGRRWIGELDGKVPLSKKSLTTPSGRKKLLRED